jgi:isopenicillin-N epimerase
MSESNSPNRHLRRGNEWLSAESHKWLCAPVGAGFLYARPDRQALLQPLVVSWGWQPRQPGPSPFIDLFDWIGTDDPSAYLSVPAAISYQRERDWPAVRTACHALAVEARDGVTALTGLAPIALETTDFWGQMVAVPLPANAEVHAVEFQRRLYDDLQVEFPITEWQG